MKKSTKIILALLLATSLCIGILPGAMAATPPEDAANKLQALGLFQGYADGSFKLEGDITRAEAVTMLVRLIGKETLAYAQEWPTPFTDAQGWMSGTVGYAYAHGLTNGKSATEFGSRDSVTASQYLTFVLRALGYESGRDFEWDSAWTLTNQLGITNGEYNSGNNKSFKRGDAASVSFDALKAINKATDEPLFESLLESGAIKREAAESVGLISSKPIIPTPEPTPAPAPTSETDIERVVRVLKSFKSISDISISGDTVSYTVEGFSGDYIVIYETPEEAYRAAHNSMISSSRFENIVMYMNVQINAETYEYLRALEELSRELYFEFCLTNPAANS